MSFGVNGRAGHSFHMSVVLLAFAIALMGFLFEWQTSNQHLVRHTVGVQLRVAEVRSLLGKAQSSQTGFLLTGRQFYKVRFHSVASALDAELDELKAEILDPVLAETFSELLPIMDEQLAHLRDSIEAHRSGALGQPDDAVQSDRELAMSDRAEQVLDRMSERLERLLLQWTDLSQSSRLSVEAVVLGSFFLACILGWRFVKSNEFQISLLKEANAALFQANETVKAEAERRSRLESQLHQSQKLESIGQLTGGIAHDFNNMLSVIINCLQLVKRLRSRGDERFPKFIDDALEAANRATNFTKSLLAFSRQHPLDPRPIDGNRYVSDISELLQHTLGGSIEIETVPGNGVWQTRADPNLLESAILNLALNARDAMPDGGKLTIETANAFLDKGYAASNAEVTPGEYVLLSISDTGCGMAPELVERAFEPFFTTKETGKGTGLGLSQVYGFIKQSGGHIKIYSEIGEGTTVKIYLPRLAEVEPTGRENLRTTPQRQIPLGSASEVVLVVDDDEKVLRTTAETFRELGYTVFEAPRPSEALRTLEVHPEVALMFTDVVMPEMSGRNLAAAAIAKHPNLKVIYATGFSRNAIVHNGMLDPGIQFVTKPFTIEQLAEKVRNVLAATDLVPSID
jgi:signal transduction histidine kinase/ActR/RegA family two-component response regulator